MHNLNKLTAILTTPLAFTINIEAWSKGVQLFSPFVTLIISLLSIISLIMIIRANISKHKENLILNELHKHEIDFYKQNNNKTKN